MDGAMVGFEPAPDQEGPTVSLYDIPLRALSGEPTSVA